MNILIHDRVSAGRDLARSLTRYRKPADVIVLALPRASKPGRRGCGQAQHAPRWMSAQASCVSM